MVDQVSQWRAFKRRGGNDCAGRINQHELSQVVFPCLHFKLLADIARTEQVAGINSHRS